MRAIVRTDEQGVSPVIATILMVAITVVLAAVLYVMVSGLISTPTQPGTGWGFSLGQSTNGSNWTVGFTAVPPSAAQSSVFITVNSAGGAAIESNQKLSDVYANACQGTSGAKGLCYGMYYHGSSPTAVSAGDSLLLLVSQFPSGSSIQIVSGSTVVYTHALT